MLKYLGCLDEAQLKTLDDNSKIDVLKEHNLIIFSESKVIEASINTGLSRLLFKNKFKGITNKYSYSKDVASDYLSFLLQHYSCFIDGEVFQYKRDFDLKTNLLEKKKAKEFALSDFIRIFEMIVDVRFISLEKDVHGEMRVGNRFKLLDKEKNNKYIDRLRHQKDNVLQYLIGDTDFFDVDFFNNNGWLQEIIDFEIGSQILIYLNDKFQFESVEYNSENKKAILIHEKFKGKFESLEQLIFIENQIENQENVDRAFIISLFYFFKREINLKMPSAKLFTQIINDFFELNIGLIKDPSSETKAHLKRTEKLKNEWENFTSRISKI